MLLVLLSAIKEKEEGVTLCFIDNVNRDLQDISANIHLEVHAGGYVLYDLEQMLGTFDSVLQRFTPTSGIDLTDQHTQAVVAVMRHRDDAPLTMQSKLLRELHSNLENRFNVVEKNDTEYIVDCNERVVARVDSKTGEYTIIAKEFHNEDQTIAYLTRDILVACF